MKLKKLSENEKYKPDVIILLQPTSPLRNKKHVNEALNIFMNNNKSNIDNPFLSNEHILFLKKQTYHFKNINFYCNCIFVCSI